MALGTKENVADVVNVVDSYVSRPTEASSHRRYVAAHGVSLLVASSAAVSMMLLMGCVHAGKLRDGRHPSEANVFRYTLLLLALIVPYLVILLGCLYASRSMRLVLRCFYS